MVFAYGCFFVLVKSIFVVFDFPSSFSKSKGWMGELRIDDHHLPVGGGGEEWCAHVCTCANGIMFHVRILVSILFQRRSPHEGLEA